MNNTSTADGQTSQVSPEIRKSIQNAYRQYLKARDMKPRSGQRHMIAEIARYLSSIALDGDFKRSSDPGACVIEAGTGTGKTLAYLISSLPFAAALRKNIVVSTATVTLQQQIIERELPLIQQHTGLDFSIALAKGRGRYLCLHRLDMHLQGEQQGALALGGTGFELEQPDEYSAQHYQQFLDWMVDAGWAGDFDSLPEPVDERLWGLVTTDHRQCLNKRCGFLSQCPYFRNKAQVDQASIIVANHDLVFADLNLGGGFILPPPEQTIYIFDEAHHLADKAISHFAFSAGLKSSQKNLRALSKAIADGQSAWADDREIRGHVEPISSLGIECNQRLEELHKYFWSAVEWQRERDSNIASHRYPMGQLPEECQKLAAATAKKTEELTFELSDLLKRLRELVDQERQGALARQMLEQALMNLAQSLSQMENLDAVWGQMSKNQQVESIPSARWLTSIGDDSESDILVHVSPTNVSDMLQQRLWQRAFAVIMTSATMSVAGSFERLNMQSGVPEGAFYAIHHSPFDFANKCTLQLCDVGYEPSDRMEYLESLSEAIKELVNPAEGTLVLFSSRRHMEFVSDYLQETYAPDFLLVQGSVNKNQLLDSHRQRIEKGQGSLLFGLASFAEGLDLPGKFLTHVIIAKLPFSVPDDPVESTYAEWLRTKGLNPFQQVVLPDAITRLLQACGRLLRSEYDEGVISLCDRRLWTKSYGHTILQALPPYSRKKLTFAQA